MEYPHTTVIQVDVIDKLEMSEITMQVETVEHLSPSETSEIPTEADQSTKGDEISDGQQEAEKSTEADVEPVLTSATEKTPKVTKKGKKQNKTKTKDANQSAAQKATELVLEMTKTAGMKQNSTLERIIKKTTNDAMNNKLFPGGLDASEFSKTINKSSVKDLLKEMERFQKKTGMEFPDMGKKKDKKKDKKKNTKAEKSPAVARENAEKSEAATTTTSTATNPESTIEVKEDATLTQEEKSFESSSSSASSTTEAKKTKSKKKKRRMTKAEFEEQDAEFMEQAMNMAAQFAGGNMSSIESLSGLSNNNKSESKDASDNKGKTNDNKLDPSSVFAQALDQMKGTMSEVLKEVAKEEQARKKKKKKNNKAKKASQPDGVDSGVAIDAGGNKEEAGKSGNIITKDASTTTPQTSTPTKKAASKQSSSSSELSSNLSDKLNRRISGLSSRRHNKGSRDAKQDLQKRKNGGKLQTKLDLSGSNLDMIKKRLSILSPVKLEQALQYFAQEYGDDGASKIRALFENDNETTK